MRQKKTFCQTLTSTVTIIALITLIFWWKTVSVTLTFLLKNFFNVLIFISLIIYEIACSLISLWTMGFLPLWVVHVFLAYFPIGFCLFIEKSIIYWEYYTSFSHVVLLISSFSFAFYVNESLSLYSNTFIYFLIAENYLLVFKWYCFSQQQQNKQKHI